MSIGESVPPGVSALVDVFKEVLPGVKFPDMDVRVLEGCVEEVNRAAEALRVAEVAADAARAKLLAAQEVAITKGQRALAYLRVFAEEDSALSTRLEAVALPKAVRKGLRSEEPPVEAARRRGRPPRVKEAATLFESKEGSEERPEVPLA